MKDLIERFKDGIWESYQQAKAVIASGGETPMVLINLQNNSEAFMPAIPEVGRLTAKEFIAAFIRELLQIDGNLVLLHRFEAWRAEVKKEDAKKLQDPRFRPSKDPGRIESVIFVVRTRTGSAIGYADIDRKAKTLKPIVWPDLEQQSGRFLA